MDGGGGAKKPTRAPTSGWRPASGWPLVMARADGPASRRAITTITAPLGLRIRGSLPPRTRILRVPVDRVLRHGQDDRAAAALPERRRRAHPRGGQGGGQ